MLGVVGGYPVPEVNRIVNAFIAGAQETNEDVDVKVTFLNSWFDPAAAKEAALAQVGAGADVLFAERFGVIEAADENDLVAVGNMSDQQELAPDNVVTSVTWNMTPTVEYVIDQVAAGSYTAQDLKDFSMVGKGGAALRQINADVMGGVPDDVLQRGRGAGGRDQGGNVPSRHQRGHAARIHDSGRLRLDGAGWPRRTLTRPLSSCAGSRSASATSSPTTASTSTSRRGEVHALLGENGAGKTTVMRIAYGLTHADAGQVLVDGKLQADPLAARRDRAGIGMVTQHFALVRPMTVAENLVLGRSRGLRLDLRRGPPPRDGCIGAIRDSRRSGGARGRAVGRAAAARRDPQGALSRLPDPDPRRADRGARA